MNRKQRRAMLSAISPAAVRVNKELAELACADTRPKNYSDKIAHKLSPLDATICAADHEGQTYPAFSFLGNAGMNVPPQAPSAQLPPVVITYIGDAASQFIHEWKCGPYYGTFRRHKGGFPMAIGSLPLHPGEWAVISIARTDHTAARDFRDWQHIKNELVTPEWEAVELFPAESRLVDPSNSSYLWCVPKGIFTFGWPRRNVLQPHESAAPQRPFPPGVVPKRS